MVIVLTLLVAIGYNDWQHRRIPNVLVAILAGWAACYAAFFANISLQHIVINIGAGLLLTLPGYIKNVVGGGDIKLMLAISPLWPPLQFLSVFSVGVLSLLLLIQLAQLVSKKVQTSPSDPNTENNTTCALSRGLPLGTAIALGVTVVSGFNFLKF